MVVERGENDRACLDRHVRQAREMLDDAGEILRGEVVERTEDPLELSTTVNGTKIAADDSNTFRAIGRCRAASGSDGSST